MSITDICDLIISILGLVPALISIVALIKNIITQKNWTLVTEITRTAMSSTEAYSQEHLNMSSEDKLNMALAAVKSGLAAANISVNEALLTKVTGYIEQLCSWAKTVNANKN